MHRSRGLRRSVLRRFALCVPATQRGHHRLAVIRRQGTFGPALDETIVARQQARAVPIPNKVRELAVGHVYVKRGEDGIILERLDTRAAGKVGILAPHHLDLEEPSIGGAIHPAERVAMKSEILADAGEEARSRGVVADAADHARDGDLARAEVVGIAEFRNIDDDIAAIQVLQPGLGLDRFRDIGIHDILLDGIGASSEIAGGLPVAVGVCCQALGSPRRFRPSRRARISSNPVKRMKRAMPPSSP